MGNMSYCRFENTSKDVRECIGAIRDGELDDMSDYEIEGFINFVRLCKEVADMYKGMDEKEVREYINDFQENY